jgi:error-prone DNA polymerase
MTVHLHVHSNFSFGLGASPIADLCAAASRRGIETLAVTDRNGLYGAMELVERAAAFGLHAVMGAEVDDGEGRRAVLLAADRRGYGRLCRIITARHTAPRFSLAAFLAEDMEGMVAVTDSIPLLEFLLSAAGRTRDIYVEVPPRFEPYGAVRSPSGFSRTHLAAFARKAGLPAVVAHPVHFADPGDRDLACMLRSIFTNASYHRVRRSPGDDLCASSWLVDGETLRRGAEDIPGAFRSALEIARRCTYLPGTGGMLLPRHPGSDGYGASVALLRARCAEGLRDRFGAAPPAAAVRRLRYELEMITSMNLADYFLIVSDIASFARGRSIPMCGRGSAAGSLVSYVLGITDVDPVRENLSFERFLHTGRKDPPDVDMDFAWDRRDEVIDFVYRRFGAERVAAISTHVTFGARGALREVARAMGLSDAQVSGVARLIPWHASAGSIGRICGSAVEDEPWKSVVALAARLDGYPKHLGIHVGGMVVCPGPLADYLPVEIAPKGIAITQWEMTGVEKAGLLKIDILGNRSLSVIDDVLDDVSRDAGTRRRALAMPFFRDGGTGGRLELAGGDRLDADPEVRELLRTGGSFGCFYVESPAMRGLLRKLRCDTFRGLVAASSVIRPGVASSGMMRQYIERARGRPFRHLHPVMEKLLGETFGVMVYQEDVMRLAYHVGGLSWEDGNLMRKAMSGKRGGVPVERYRDRFLDGAVRRGLPPDVAREIWRQMASFAGYSFCKAHSAAFAEVSMRALLLRAHFPAEFMAAVLSNHGGYYGTSAYVSECRRMGLRVLPPSVNASEVRCTGRGRSVRVGLGEVAKLGAETAVRIVEERRVGGAFASLEAFLLRMKGRIARDETEGLVMAGALDEFERNGNRRLLLWECARLSAPRAPSLDGSRALPSIGFDRRAKAAMEVEALGFPLCCHVMELVRPSLAKLRPVEARSLTALRGRKVTVAGMVVTLKPISTSKGEAMSFVSMEDETAIFEVTLFPSAYRKSRRLLAWSAGPYVVRGTVDDDFGHISVIGEEIRPICLEKAG